MIKLSADLSLPDDAVTQTFAFIARRGAGKTYGASVLAEGFFSFRSRCAAPSVC